MVSGERNLTELVRMMADMLRREHDGERIGIEIGPHTALMLAVRCVLGESEEVRVLPPALFDGFLSEIRRAFADEPDVLALLQLREAPSAPEQAEGVR